MTELAKSLIIETSLRFPRVPTLLLRAHRAPTSGSWFLPMPPRGPKIVPMRAYGRVIAGFQAGAVPGQRRSDNFSLTFETTLLQSTDGCCTKGPRAAEYPTPSCPLNGALAP